MKTITIRYLEYKRTQLLAELINCDLEKKDLLNQELIEINHSIDQEQVNLWNYYLQTPITLDNFEYLCDIIRYFDQINYADRLFDKITKEIEQLREDFDYSLLAGDDIEVEKIKEELAGLHSLLKLLFN